MSITVTRGIKIDVIPQYDTEHSKPELNNFVYAYAITITNDSKEDVQLISRHWVITDGFNKVEHVKGPGVVGKQPHLSPGQSFTYSSYCPLQTPTGSMKGTFQMKTSSQHNFDAEIGEFFLRNEMLVN